MLLNIGNVGFDLLLEILDRLSHGDHRLLEVLDVPFHGIDLLFDLIDHQFNNESALR